VDVHVGKFLMEESILDYLKGKTVVMPTHAVKYLEYADNIIVMEKGKIVASGSYKDISDSL
jgi:ABC-type transport system involved in cytochrome bd biosynthesis fused ATPase/permease subunit